MDIKLRVDSSMVERRTCSDLSFNAHARLGEPGAATLRAFRRLAQFVLGELKATLATARRRDRPRILRVFQTQKQMLQVIRYVARRFLDEPSDLRHGHRVVVQEVDEIFAEHEMKICLRRRRCARNYSPFAGGIPARGKEQRCIGRRIDEGMDES